MGEITALSDFITRETRLNMYRSLSALTVRTKVLRAIGTNWVYPQAERQSERFCTRRHHNYMTSRLSHPQIGFPARLWGWALPGYLSNPSVGFKPAWVANYQIWLIFLFFYVFCAVFKCNITDRESSDLMENPGWRMVGLLFHKVAVWMSHWKGLTI